MSQTSHSADPFIPIDRRLALVAGKPLPERTSGAYLFADLSGFTALTNWLAEEIGPQRGAEELTHQLNEIFTALIDEVHRYRGSALGFSGDGLSCWFDQDDGLRAVTCGLAFQRIIAEKKHVAIGDGNVFPLGIKVAVTGGPVQRFLVGDPAIQRMDVLAGKALDRAAQAEHVMSSGDVVIGAELFAGLGGYVEGLEWLRSEEGEFYGLIRGLKKTADPDPWPTVPQLEESAAKDWVLPLIYDRLLEGSGEFLAELRRVVPLYLRFRGIDFDADPLAGDKLDAFIRAAQAVLVRYEGNLGQLTIGDKGSYLGVTFGAPVAHEDDINRALQSALQLQAAAAKLPFIQSIQIGITSGWVLAGAYGGAQRRTYGVQGPDVNLAARLMARAEPGQVLVSEIVADSASSFQFEPLEAVQMKGLAEPMTPFALSGSQSVLSGRRNGTAIIGRESERTQIREHLLRLLAEPGTPRPNLVIDGEAGIGKSYLVTDLHWQAEQRSVLVLSAEGDEIERATPYYAWRPILLALLGCEENDEEALIRQKMSDALAGDNFLVARAPILADLLPIEFSDNQLTSQIRGEARSTSLQEVLIWLLRRSLTGEDGSARPMILVFDDAQWIDSATWALIHLIHKEVPELLLVIVARPVQAEGASDEIREAFARLISRPDIDRLQLASLSRDDTARLVSRRLQAASLPDNLLEFIHERAQGNPFFTEEIAYALRDTGLVQIQNGSVGLASGAGDLQDIAFPDTIHGVITSRIDRLSPAHQLTLKVASVIGRIFLYQILSKIYPVPVNEPELRQNLQLLAELDITPIEALEPDLTYFFKHVITQEVVYQLMTFAQREGLHQAAGLWYEHTGGDDLSPYYARLAYHWQHAGDPDKAILYLERAAEQALELYSNHEVIQFLDRARALDEKRAGSSESSEARQVRLGHWERVSGLAHFRSGHLSEARAHYCNALAVLGQPVPSGAGVALGLIKELGRQFFHRLRPAGRWRAVSAAEQPVTQKLSEIDIGTVFYYSQEVGLLAWDMLRRLNLAEKLEWEAGKAEGYSNLILFAGFLNLDSVAGRYRRLTSKAVEKSGSTAVRVYTLLREAVYLYPRCQWESAVANLEEGIRLARQIGDNRQWEECAATLATCLHHLARYPDALAIWTEHKAHALQTDSPQALAWGLFGEGYNTLYLGEIEEARRLLEASLATPMGDAIDKILEASRASALALALARLGEHDRAWQVIADHQANHPASPSVSSSINEYGGCLDALLALREAELAGEFQPETAGQRSWEQALKQGRQTAAVFQKRFAVNRAGAWYYGGLFDWLDGKTDKAVNSWRRCIREAEANQQPYEAGRAYYELGHRLPEAHPGSLDSLNKAVEIFTELETNYDLARAIAARNQGRVKTAPRG